MRKQNKERKKIPYESEQLKDGIYTEQELKQYNFTDDEIAVILEYQRILPILQTDDENQKVNARDLHKQLQVGRQFTDWITRRIKSYQLVNGVDYFTVSQKCEIAESTGFKDILDYHLTIDCAKQLAMVERTDIGALTRRYFIIMEKAFKRRYEWNHSRKNTLINCKELRQALITKKKELLDGRPSWMKVSNEYVMEFGLLNTVILGMSASSYKKMNNIPDKDMIRNYFTEDQLDDVERLERYDAQLIMVQAIYDYDTRKSMLTDEYRLHKNRMTKYV